MFLAIDVGNTQTTLGLIDTDGKVGLHMCTSTNQSMTADEIQARLTSFLHMHHIDENNITAAAVSCVVPALSYGWKHALSKTIHGDVLLIDGSNSFGIQTCAKNPSTIGADRLANVAQVLHIHKEPAIVVDFGTATNIDVVSKDGVYLGGPISPGVMISAQALFSRAAKLANVELKVPEKLCADTTETAVQAGIVVGAAAQAEGLVARIKQEMHQDDACVIATGGLAKLIAQASDIFDIIDPDFTLKGIFEIYKRSTTLHSV